ncbi:hypothetical protein I6N98_03880 [Spongiibacter nanhainus]|uniref:Photosynthesis system II assembly factor Ycf48/Hcf136-like domain-containing protein n=1 Tax=Spongiibacter nanhainus TaxID=2794344 RepID=A0A7T4UQQ9_9GAMM|nr:YCF48-related protein [Spongiibacter nanhainus]QQD19008.1 hypothetical protein I6N98_03880 [Spongiibacter nanhainus]
MKAVRALLTLSLVVATGQGFASDEGLIYQGTAHDAFFGIDVTERGLVAVGAGGLYSISANGKDWQHTSIASPDVSLLSVTEKGGDALAVGQGGVVMRRDGDRWSEVATPTKERLLSVAQGKGGLALAVGGFGTVLRSVDGGNSWEKLTIDWESLIQQPYEPHVYNCLVDAKGDIFIVGEFGMIARSQDRGDTWQALNSGEESLFGIAINASGIGVAVGQSGLVLRSGDGGESWQELDSQTGAILLDVAVRDDGAAVVSGIREALAVSASGRTVRRLNSPEFLEDWFVDVAVFQRDFYLVGQQAQVVKVKL